MIEGKIEELKSNKQTHFYLFIGVEESKFKSESVKNFLDFLCDAMLLNGYIGTVNVPLNSRNKFVGFLLETTEATRLLSIEEQNKLYEEVLEMESDLPNSFYVNFFTYWNSRGGN